MEDPWGPQHQTALPQFDSLGRRCVERILLCKWDLPSLCHSPAWWPRRTGPKWGRKTAQHESGFLLGLAVKRKGQRLRDTMGQFCLDWGLQKVLKYFLYRQGDTRSFSLSIPWQYDASLSLSHVLSYWITAVVPEGKIVIISLSSRWPDWCREKVGDLPNVLQAAGGTGETQSQYLGSKSQALHPAANHHLSKMQIPIILQGQLKVQDLVSRFAADSCEGTRLRGKSQAEWV